MAELLALDQAAINYHKEWFGIPKQWTPINITEIQFQQNIDSAFKAGAEWQKEQFLDVLKTIAKWPGNLPDSKLMSRTGPGNMVVTMRQIAMDVITKFEPDFKPYQD